MQFVIHTGSHPLRRSAQVLTRISRLHHPKQSGWFAAESIKLLIDVLTSTTCRGEHTENEIKKVDDELAKLKAERAKKKKVGSDQKDEEEVQVSQ